MSFGCVLVFMFFFFFSSRRRHTRWNCDWSSDVCSSDLGLAGREANDPGTRAARVRFAGGTRCAAKRSRTAPGREFPSWNQGGEITDDGHLSKDLPHFQFTGGLSLAKCRELFPQGLAAIWERVK